MRNYIPENDAEFHIWQAGLVEIIESNQLIWEIPITDMTVIKMIQGNWSAAFGNASNKQNRTSADVQAKDDERATYEKDIRGFVAQWLANNTKVMNSDRERMGITVKSDSRTPAPTPTTFPVGVIDFSVRLQHTIHYTDQVSPWRKAKPDGVHGCEIWMKIDGDAPIDPSELSFLTTDTSTPYTATFEGKYGGKTVYYWFRWVNTRGEHGPWGSAISAMVVG